MRTIDEIIQAMYSSKDFSTKGRVKNLKDAFLMIYKCEPYVVFITENCNFDGSNLHFDYSAFSVSERQAVAKSSELFQELIEALPPLDNLSIVGGKFDISQKRKLEKEFNEIARAFIEKGLMSDSEIDRYRVYLSEMKKLKSPSFEGVYDYFANSFRR